MVSDFSKNDGFITLKHRGTVERSLEEVRQQVLDGFTKTSNGIASLQGGTSGLRYKSTPCMC